MACCQRIKFGGFHLDAKDTMPDHLLVQIGTFGIEDIGRIDAAYMGLGPFLLCRVNGRPQQLPLKSMLQHFVDFLREVVVRRTAFDLRKAEDRAHILEGLKIAIDNLDEIVSLIRASKTPPEAKEALRLWFKFSERQAQAILEMRLQRLTGLERQKIVDEYEATLKLIAKLQGILASGQLQLQIVIDELDKIKEAFGNPRRTEIEPVADELSLEDLIDEEDVVITVSATGYIKRTPLSTYESQQRGGKALHLGPCRHRK